MTRGVPSGALRGPLALGVVAVLAVVLAAAGCGGPTGGGGRPARLTVLAAASLTDAFTELGRAYERSQGDVRPVFSFAGSQAVAAQVREGAPADVVATADQRTMDQLAPYVQRPEVFAGNRLTIAVAPGNPKGISGLADLARADVTVVLAAPEVPAGHYAGRALDRAGVAVRPASLEPDVRAVLSRVELGEADAGIVYVTDVEATEGSVARVAVDDEYNVEATYPAAVVSSSERPQRAATFVSWLRGAEAGKVLTRYGFTTP